MNITKHSQRIFNIANKNKHLRKKLPIYSKSFINIYLKHYLPLKPTRHNIKN